jgi:hypothetical protein
MHGGVKVAGDHLGEPVLETFQLAVRVGEVVRIGADSQLAGRRGGGGFSGAGDGEEQEEAGETGRSAPSGRTLTP